MDDDTLFYLLLSGYCMLWFSICFLLWKKEQRIKDSSTEKIIGKVIGYTISRNLHAPKVAYFVDGVRYIQKLKYFTRGINKKNQIFHYQNEEELKKEVLRDRIIIYEQSISYDFEKLWPVGSTMTVYYNPDNPKISYVERYAGAFHFFRNGCIISAFIEIIFTIIFFLYHFL